MIFRKAANEEIGEIWQILQDAIAQRKQDGSDQWQNGYPNENSIREDLAGGHAWVLADGDTIVAYAAVIFGEEPAYNQIEGKWLSYNDYVVVHRVATAKAAKRTGMGRRLFLEIEKLCLDRHIFSIKVDTNFDNLPMLRIFEKLGYVYCGEVLLQGAPRKGFEKLLSTE